MIIVKNGQPEFLRRRSDQQIMNAGTSTVLAAIGK